MQRGLRFCKNERNLWLQYAKLEMIYVAKIAARRKILGLDVLRTTKEIDSSHDADADMIALPEITAEDINPDLKKDMEAVDEEALQKLSSTPALTGAIPMTIMDTAMNHFQNDPILVERFFTLFAEFPSVDCTRKLLDHCVSQLERISSSNPKANLSLAYCTAASDFVGVDSTSAEFPLALGKTLQGFKRARAANKEAEAGIATRAVLLLLPILARDEDLDEGVVAVLDASIKQHIRLVAGSKATPRGIAPITEMTRKLQTDKRVGTKLLADYGLVESDQDQPSTALLLAAR